jgi:hypothetical protein
MNKNELDQNDLKILIHENSINLVKGLILKNSGLFKIQSILRDKKFTCEIFISEIYQFLKLNNQLELFSTIFNFINQVKEKKNVCPKETIDLENQINQEKEILFYCHELVISNQSKFNFEQIKNIFLKLLEMLDSIYKMQIEENSLSLVESCLRDLSIPASISQQTFNTCSAACIQHLMVIREPLEYLNIIDALAQNKIYFTLNKKIIESNWIFNCGYDNIDKRTISAKIFQNAVMNFEQKNAIHTNKKINNLGLSQENTIKIYYTLINGNYKIYNSSDFTPNYLIEIIKNSQPSRTNPIYISMHYMTNGSHALHSLNIIGYDDKYQDILAFNPWGREEFIGIEILKARISSIIALSEADKIIPRVPEMYFKQAIKTYNMPFYITNIFGISIEKNWSDEKLDKYLNCLTMDQKVEIILSLWSGKLKNNKKIIILKILKNILQNSDLQNKGVLFELHDKLEKKGENILCLVCELKMKTELFNEIIRKIGLAIREWEQVIIEVLNIDFIGFVEQDL